LVACCCFFDLGFCHRIVVVCVQYLHYFSLAALAQDGCCSRCF
jgi:hypothetical protein